MSDTRPYLAEIFFKEDANREEIKLLEKILDQFDCIDEFQIIEQVIENKEL